MTPETFGPLAWMDVVSHDLATSANFYHNVFGWDLGESVDHHGGSYYLMSTDGSVVAGAEQIGPEKGEPRWTIFVTTESMQSFIATVRSQGCTVTFEPQALADLGIIAMITDPHGATMGVWQPLTLDPTATGPVAGRMIGAEITSPDLNTTVDFLSEVLGWQVDDSSDDSVTFITGGMLVTVTSGVHSEWMPRLRATSDQLLDAITEHGGSYSTQRADSRRVVTDAAGARFVLGTH